MTSKTLKLGNIEVTTGTETAHRMAILLWGPSSVGKTTFAATAPGKKLWLSIGDNEHVSVSSRPDVLVARLYDQSFQDLFKHGQGDNPFGLDTFLADHEEIHTVVVDSLTALTFRALQKAIDDGIGRGKGFVPTIEAPGIAAYGGRNGLVIDVITGLLRVTAKHNCHIIMTAHEADPTTDSDGIVLYISTQLGGKIVNDTTWRFSEIWYLGLNSKGERELTVRPTQLRRPMKTRLFSNDPQRIKLEYNPEVPDAKQRHTINAWFKAWEKAGYARIPLK